MTARSRAAAVLAASLAIAVPAGAASAGPVAGAARSCGYSRHLGYSYVTSIHVRHVSCRTGKRVVRRYHDHHRVSGYHCHRHVLDSSPFQYDARVTCRGGSRRVIFTYTQNK